MTNFLNEESYTVAIEDINAILEALKTYTEYDISDYSEKSLRRRIDKIYYDYKLSISDILKKIEKKPDFVEKFIKDITVNTTEIFRDPKVWLEIIDKIIPALQKKDSINIWHCGCSSGQELYSMLILLHEHGIFEKVNIIGTDINSDVLEDARKGKYKYRFIAENLPNFDKVLNIHNDNYKIPYESYMEISESKDLLTMKPFLTAKPRFFRHDIVGEGNIFGIKFDLIMCRNVLIYFNQKLQDKAFKLFWDCLADNSFMVIGLHESIMGNSSKLFKKNGQVYIKNKTPIDHDTAWKP